MTIYSQITPSKNKIQELEKQIKDNKKVLARFHQEQIFPEKVLDNFPGIFYLYDEDDHLDHME